MHIDLQENVYEKIRDSVMAREMVDSQDAYYDFVSIEHVCACVYVHVCMCVCACVSRMHMCVCNDLKILSWEGHVSHAYMHMHVTDITTIHSLTESYHVVYKGRVYCTQ